MRQTAGHLRFPLLAAGLLAAAAGGRGQDPAPKVQYWPLRDLVFPVPVEKFRQMDVRPSKLRFLVARGDQGPFSLVAEKGIDDLDDVDLENGRTARGFRYKSPADGDYDFALQFVSPAGELSPPDRDLTAYRRIRFDTRPPVVRAAPDGAFAVRWEVTDDNPDPDGVTVETRWRAGGEAQPPAWRAATDRRFKLRDRVSYKAFEPKSAGEVLEVRVTARDRAGHKGSSRIIALPAKGEPAGDDPDPPGPDRGPGRGGDDGPAAGRSAVDYVKTRSLTVESKLTKVTRSGVVGADLWVDDGTGAGWKRSGERLPLRIEGGAADGVIRIPFDAPKDGRYGFLVIPVNGAGGKLPDPVKGDPPQSQVEVDTSPPAVAVSRVEVNAGGAKGPRVLIEWKASDNRNNLTADPITLEYADHTAPGVWKTVPGGANLPNTGKYVWEVDDDGKLWKFKVRARAVDLAGNEGQGQYAQDVTIDLDNPQTVIEKVVPAGGPGAGAAPPRAYPREDPRPAAPPPAPAARRPEPPAPLGGGLGGLPTPPPPPTTGTGTPAIPDLGR